MSNPIQILGNINISYPRTFESGDLIQSKPIISKNGYSRYLILQRLDNSEFLCLVINGRSKEPGEVGNFIISEEYWDKIA